MVIQAIILLEKTYDFSKIHFLNIFINILFIANVRFTQMLIIILNKQNNKKTIYELKFEINIIIMIIHIITISPTPLFRKFLMRF